jgi:hypothetical protein
MKQLILEAKLGERIGEAPDERITWILLRKYPQIEG